MFFIALGAVIQDSAYSVPQLMVGRIITGFGVGIDTSTIPMYQSELCKREHRGRLVTAEVMFTAVGVSIAYFFDYGMSFASGPIAWRLPIALQIPMAASVALLVVGLPETPRWLIQQGRTEEGVAILAKVWNLAPDDPVVETEKREILEAISLEEKDPFKWIRIFKRDPVQTGWRVFLACLVLFMNQVSLFGGDMFVTVAMLIGHTVGRDQRHRLLFSDCPRSQRRTQP
jgi:MFS family permease